MNELFNNEPISREEIENILRGYEKKASQSSYSRIVDINGKHVYNVAYMNKISIYNDSIFSKNEIIWDDSIGQKQEDGSKFLGRKVPTFFFKEFSKKPKRYLLVGELKEWKIRSVGEKHIVPNSFLISFLNNIDESVVNLFEDIEVQKERMDLREYHINRSPGTFDPARAKAIGDKGEAIFNDHLNMKYGSYEDVLNLIESSSIEYKWVNKEKERFKPYDFIINDVCFDVKTTTTNVERFYISKNEYELLIENKLNIVQIFLDKKMLYKKHNVITSENVVNKYSFIAQSYEVRLK